MEPKNAFRYAWQPYVVAIALIAAAAALRLWPLQALGARLAWLTFYPAVVVAALYGGFSAGLLGTFLSCLTALFLLPVFVDQPFIRDSADWLGTAVFFITCTMISGVAEAMRRAQARAKQASEQLETANIKLQEEITERKRIEEEIRTHTAELAAANKELEAFSYSVSHDLRAPLRAIDGFSRVLEEDYAPQLTPDANRYLQLVRGNAKQMGELIDDLLTFARLSRQAIRKQKVSVVHVVRQCLDELQDERKGRRLEITVGDLPPCEADPALLKQVFVNLLSNALKFTRRRDAALVHIGFQQADGRCVYFVRDNGAGFDMKYADKMFGVFQRMHRAEEYEGTGVGLAIVQRIVHRHGGRVWAEAEVDKGATFYFALKGDSEL